jgi:hypothetical protein
MSAKDERKTPGTGKTTLTLQFLLNGARNGIANSAPNSATQGENRIAVPGMLCPSQPPCRSGFACARTRQEIMCSAKTAQGREMNQLGSQLDVVATIIFGLALVHTFAAKSFERLARRSPHHAGLFHLLGEVEVVFGIWAFVLVVAMALLSGSRQAIDYAESRQYAEPLFVFVIMVIAASRPVLDTVRGAITALAGLAPGRAALITEPAAMTLAALMLAPVVFQAALPEWLKYGVLGVLFVNISIGGTLTSFAAPPVLMVASAWNWDSAHMAAHFGWKAALAVLINASVLALLIRPHLARLERIGSAGSVGSTGNTATDTHATPAIPLLVRAIHLLFLATVVGFAHHPVIFLGVFLFFIGFTAAYPQYQSPLILKEGLLVGFFLAGLVVLGGMQQWWLQPIVSGLEPRALFFGALGLTAITDNAALTYLGSLIDGLSDSAKYMLVAGAVAGGGLTVVANAPNPAGVALLRDGFQDGTIGVGGLLAGAMLPTIVAAACLLLPSPI